MTKLNLKDLAINTIAYLILGAIIGFVIFSFWREALRETVL